MSIGDLLYKDLPKLISAIRNLSSSCNVHSRGLTFKLVSDNWITKYRARSFNDKEPEMLDWIDGNLKEDDVFFDIGANVGIYSIYAAFRNPHSLIFAFEPEYSNLHQLKQNIIINNLKCNIFPYAVALAENNGISQLHIQDATPGAAMATISNQKIDTTYLGQEIVWKEGVATLTLDKFCSLSGIKPNIIKIDVDGNETAILKGGGEHIS